MTKLLITSMTTYYGVEIEAYLSLLLLLDLILDEALAYLADSTLVANMHPTFITLR